MYTEKEVLDFIQEVDVKFIRLIFFDINGKQKNISIMAGQLSKAFKNGISFDASSIQGFQTPDKSDLFLHPDPSTISILPWRPNQGKVVRMFCEIRYPDGTPYEKDCRYLLKTAIIKAKKECNIELMIGTEVEFYLFKLDEKDKPTKNPFDYAGYMDIAPEDKGENIRRDICFTLEQMGIMPETSHHECGPGQNEIDFHYGDPLLSADNTSTFKWIVRTKSAANGLYADFSPKPLEQYAGSGMHINISCSNPEKNKNIVAGILKYIKEMTFFFNPAEASYKRLGNFTAPKYISWDKENRSQLIRIPASKQDQRIELRSPDPEANPYLAFTLIINAAIEGIQKNLEPPTPTKANLFKVNKFDTNLELLPATLKEAKSLAMNSQFVKDSLGQKIIESFD